MDRKIRDKWVEALRSGEYKQGQNALRTNDNKFCCLGVLCDVVDANCWTTRGGVYYYGLQRYTLPRQLMETLQLSIPQEAMIIELNDTGHTFEEIADYIEERL